MDGRWWGIALAIITVICFKIWWSFRRLLELASKIPGPPAVPILGNLNLLIGAPDKVFSTLFGLREKYEGFPFRFWLGPRLIVFINTPEDAEILLVKNKILKRDKFVLKVIRSAFGNGLLTSDPVTWKQHKKIIAPSFQPKIIETYIDVFNLHGSTLVKKLENFTDEKSFDIHEMIASCAVDNLCESIMGIRPNADEKDAENLGKLYLRGGQLLYLRLARPWLYTDLLYNLTALGKEQRNIEEIVCRLPQEIINKQVNEYYENRSGEKNSEDSEFKRRSVLERMLSASKDEGTVMSRQELHEEVRTLLISGSETVANSISFALMLLAVHPELQHRIYLELKELFTDNWNRPVTSTDIKKLDLLNRFIKETLRLIPVVPIVPREIEEEIQLTSCTLPAGCAVWISPMAIHHDKRNYPEPLIFDPDRFLPERVKERHPYSYIPFAAGPRMCIGFKFAEIEMTVVLVHVLKKYRILPAVTFEEIMQLEAAINLRPKCGFKVKLSHR